MTVREATKPVHGAPRDWRTEELKTHYTGFTLTPPDGCPFQVGDIVRYTNDNGCKFTLRVRGFDSEPQGGRSVFIFDDCWWYPARPEQCKLIERPAHA